MHPAAALARRREHLRLLLRRLRTTTALRLNARTLKLAELGRAVHAVSPLATLQRGYAILLDRDDGRVVRSVAQARRSTRFLARVSDGEIPLRHDPD